MNLKHADLTPAEVTGNTTTAALIEDGPMTSLNHRAQMALWSGCIDAPEAILTGGCVAVDTSRFEYGLGYEGTTARTALRAA